MQHVVVGAWLDTASLLARSATLHAAIAEEITHARTIRWRTRDLLLAPYPWIRPIAGGLDPDGTLVLEVLATSGTVCLDCLARKTGVSALSVTNVLQRFKEIVAIAATMARCDGCLRLTKTYTVNDRTDADMRPRPRTRDGIGRPRAPDLAEALWRFLTNRRGELFCTQCLATAILAIKKRIHRVVIIAEGRGALRRHGPCASCRKERLLCGLAE
jgi:hypothetical protein